jgi:hypothetical protein
MPSTGAIALFTGRIRIAGSFFDSLVHGGADVRTALLAALRSDISGVIGVAASSVEILDVAVGSLIADYAVSSDGVAVADARSQIDTAAAAVAALTRAASVREQMPAVSQLYGNVSGAAEAETLTLAAAAVTYDGAAAMQSTPQTSPASSDGGCGGSGCGAVVGASLAAVAVVVVCVAGFAVWRIKHGATPTESSSEDSPVGVLHLPPTSQPTGWAPPLNTESPAPTPIGAEGDDPREPFDETTFEILSPPSGGPPYAAQREERDAQATSFDL